MAGTNVSLNKKIMYSNQICIWIQKMIDMNIPFDQCDADLRNYICDCGNE